jgi:hypothetical protein
VLYISVRYQRRAVPSSTFRVDIWSRLQRRRPTFYYYSLHLVDRYCSSNRRIRRACSSRCPSSLHYAGRENFRNQHGTVFHHLIDMILGGRSRRLSIIMITMRTLTWIFHDQISNVARRKVVFRTRAFVIGNLTSQSRHGPRPRRQPPGERGSK